MEGRYAVITGFGAVSCLGLSAEDMWNGLIDARSGIDVTCAFDPSGFPCKLAGEAPAFKVQKHLPKTQRKLVKLMSRDIELSIPAANEAFSSAGLATKALEEGGTAIDPIRTAVNIGAGLISCDLVELAPAVARSVSNGIFDIHKWGREGMEHLTPIWLLKYLPNMPACHIGIIHDIQGPSNTITCGEVGGYLAVSEAVEVISREDADFALAGGVEAKVNPIVMTRQCLLGRSVRECADDPKRAMRPFDASACGGVFGEGAGIITLEEAEHAKDRGAEIYAGIAGTGSSSGTQAVYDRLEPDGRAVQYAIEEAMTDAGISSEQIELIVPHGTAVPEDDRAEAAGIERALGKRADQIPVYVTKPNISITGAASGALDIIAAALMMKNSLIPAVLNSDKNAEGINLNLVREKTEKQIGYALCCGFTFGGQAAAVVLKNENF